MKRLRKAAHGAINTEGWMMSYADMATILLAMFIVLSTLGQDQTGASLQKGLESWREAKENFGLPGLFKTSEQVDQLGFAHPRYHLASDEAGEGPGGEQLGLLPKSVDEERARFGRFLEEMSRQWSVERLPLVAGQATLDFYKPLAAVPPRLTAPHREGCRPLLPLLEQRDYRVIVVVWATMPRDSALRRAAEQSRQVADELANAAGLDATARANVVAVGQPWRHANFQRPVMSLILAKMKLPGQEP
jgi:hypothetical protein